MSAKTGMLRALSNVASEVLCAKLRAIPLQVQQFLWQQLFTHRKQWLGSRRRKPTSLYPDFGHKKSQVALWLGNRHKPISVDSQLAIWDGGMKVLRKSVPTSRAFRSLGALENPVEAETCRKLCEEGRITDAVDALKFLVQSGRHVDNNLFYLVLKRCIAHKDLVMGRRIHALTIKSGYEGDAFLATHLIGLYASHRRLEEAMQVFAKVSTPDTYNWATIIFAYAKHGEASQAIRLYRHMHESTVKPTDHIYLAVLKACAAARDLVAGKEVHAHILASAGNPDIFVQTGLINMYAKCGSLEDARGLFDRLHQRDAVAWTTMIAGYAQQGMGKEALNLYSGMRQEGLKPPNSITFICLLQACARVGVGALDLGKELHAQTEEQGLQGDVVVCGSLINMYVKCGSLEDARSMFDRLPGKNVVIWNAMFAGYAQQRMGQEALCLYSSMEQEGLTLPDYVTYVCILQACASVGAGALWHGKQFHAQIEEQGLNDNVALCGSLVNMYARCGSLEDARSLFDQLSDKNVVTWNAMLAGYVQQDMGPEALALYSSMQQAGVAPPNSLTFASLLQACARVGAEGVHQGKQLHAQIEDLGLQDDLVVGNCLVNMYSKCGNLADARKVFEKLPEKNIVTWNALLAGYAQNGMGQEALSLYNSLQQERSTLPDFVTFVCLLQACSSVGLEALHQGRHLHAQIEERGLQYNVVLGGSIVNMYAKCGSLEGARRVFDGLPERNVVTWNAMIAGYADQGMCREALILYSGLQHEGVTPNCVTFVCLLRASALAAALSIGKQLHAEIEDRGLQADVLVGGSLVHMYAKCGSMCDSQKVFDSLPEKTIEAWNALIGGYARQGDSEFLFDSVDRMRLEGIRADGVTFLSILAVCSHVGLVDKGKNYFEAMTKYGVSPSVEHYRCMIDILGRAGHVNEALLMARDMPFPPNAMVWLTLLGACQKWNNVEIGQQAFESAVRVDGKDAAAHVLMSNIYEGAEMCEEAQAMQARRVKSGAWKKQGESWWMDLGGVAHTFVVGDKKHRETEVIYARLEQLIQSEERRICVTS